MKLLSFAICRKISADGLSIDKAPASLHHHSRLPPQDKILWDAAYAEEFNGLRDLGTWDIITEDEYKDLKKVTGPALPSMALATFKKG